MQYTSFSIVERVEHDISPAMRLPTAPPTVVSRTPQTKQTQCTTMLANPLRTESSIVLILNTASKKCQELSTRYVGTRRPEGRKELGKSP